MRFKRLKIVEQIIIISLIGVLVPSVISWFVINNISQHSLRRELTHSVEMFARISENNINSLIKSDNNRLNEIIISLKHIPTDYAQNLYLKDVAVNSEIFKEFDLIRPSENPDFDAEKRIDYDPKTHKLFIIDKVHDDKFIKAEVNTDVMRKNIFENLKEDKGRRVYIVDNKGNLLFTLNYDDEDFKKSINRLPSNPVKNTVTSFGTVKNRPGVYLNSDMGFTVIVNTSEDLTKSTINRARMKILVAFLIAAAVTLLLTLFYSYYLYYNIRQLFKGIISVAKGNYKKTITPLTNIFTPREIIFLAEEFNGMITEINASYKVLREKNDELKRLNEFRSNLIDTVSHELRTPLTAIKGYTSRLLRTDIEIDEETKHKSLLIIKQQSERLSRMIEDLLVVPDIEGSKLNISFERVNLLNAIENSLYSVKNIQNFEIDNSVTNDFPDILADKDRFEQVLINIIGNACKYAYPGSILHINARAEDDFALIEISNSADYIPEDVLNTLFEKFIRLDDKTTRTTRGTGLGLYIVKGLTQTMGGKVELASSTDNVFKVILTFPLYKKEILDSE